MGLQQSKKECDDIQEVQDDRGLSLVITLEMEKSLEI